MEPITECKSSESGRIEFIRSIEGFEKIDPFLHISKIDDIKRLLFDNGFYQRSISDIQDSSIIKLILKAQSKKITRTKAKKAQAKRKDYSL